jgi:hypothetical protein
MAIATLPWRAGRTSRPRGLAAVQDQPAVERTRFVETDSFFDLIVLISVLMFLVLAAGVGMLALQATLWR